MKHTYFALFLPVCFTCTFSFAQAVIGEQKTIGGSTNDNLQAIYLTKNGGLIAGGSSDSKISGEKTDSNRGRSDFWVVKVDSLNNIQWDRTIGGNYYDYLNSLQQTSDGGYILGGYSNSKISGEKTERSRGGEDYWVVKLDGLGNIQWDKTIGGSGDDHLYSIQQTKKGNYILGGFSNSNISKQKTQNSRGSYDYWVVKLDSSGNIIWDKTIGGGDVDELMSLQQTNDGGYIVGGFSSSKISGEKTQGKRGGNDYWVVKLDGMGNIQWDKTIGGALDDFLQSLQQTSDGGYALGGRSWSNISAEKTQNSRGDNDYWVVKLDSLGNLMWDKTIGGSDRDYLQSIQQTLDEGYILGGYSYSNISGEKTENTRGYNDYWVVKVDKQGKFQWDKTIGGNSFDILNSIIETSRNHYVLGGYSQSGISGDKTESSRGLTDYWIVFLDYKKPSPLQISSAKNKSSFLIANNARNNLIVYPNPTKNMLHVETNGKVTLSVQDASGKILLTKIIDGSGEISLANIAPGIYYLKNNATGLTEKFVVVK